MTTTYTLDETVSVTPEVTEPFQRNDGIVIWRRVFAFATTHLPVRAGGDRIRAFWSRLVLRYNISMNYWRLHMAGSSAVLPRLEPVYRAPGAPLTPEQAHQAEEYYEHRRSASRSQSDLKDEDLGEAIPESEWHDRAPVD